MRELTIEEKAKAYDEAKARMSKAFNSNRCTIGFMNEIFPEFAENEDEWMRTDCIKYLDLGYQHCSSKEDRIKIEKCVSWLVKQSSNPYSGVSFVYNGNTWGMCARDNGVDISFNRELIQHVSTEKQSKNSVKIGETYKCVASPKYTCFREGDFYYVEDNFVAELINICSDCFVLLENQCENHIVSNNEMVKPTEGEPKFKIGDIITNGNLVGIVEAINERGYHVYFRGFYSDVTDVENWHKWTLEDAKDGDVLADGDLPFIFKKTDANGYSYAYCGISVDDGFKIESEGEYGEWTWMQDIKPATKEQRKQLEKAIKEAGYRWNPCEKKLEKIEQKPWSDEDERYLNSIINRTVAFGDSSIHGLIKDDINWLKSIKDRVGCEANCAATKGWSEEDEKLMRYVIGSIDTNISDSNFKNIRIWFKSLKDRIQPQPQQEWSKEDEKIYQSIMDDTVQENQLNDKQTEWLRGIKERLFAKPQNKKKLRYIDIPSRWLRDPYISLPTTEK